MIQSLLWDGYLGYDQGAYVAGLNQLLTGNYYPPTFPRPPLAPGWQLFPFIELFGMQVGLKVWSSFVALVPIPAVFLITKHYLGDKYPWAPVFAAGFFAIDWWQSNIFVTGALPLIGIGLLGYAWWALSNLVVRYSRFHGVVLAVSVGLIPYVNQTSALFGLVFLPVFTLGLIAFQPGWPARLQAARRIFWPALAGALIGGVALPFWYLDTLPGQATMRSGCPILYINNEWAISTVQAVMAWTVGGYFLLFSRPSDSSQLSLKPLAICAIILGALQLFDSCDEVLANLFIRSWVFLALPMYPLLTWLVFGKWLPLMDRIFAFDIFMRRWLIGTSAIVVFAFYFAGSVSVVQAEAKKSLFPPAMVEALELTDPHRNVAASSFLQSFWINALRQQPSPSFYFQSPPPAYAQDYEDLRCVMGWETSCTLEKSLERLNIGYILVNPGPYRDYHGNPLPYHLAPDDLWDVPDRQPWLELVYHKGQVKMWEIR